MKINLAIWDRTIRFLISLILLTWFFSGGPNWSLIGLYFLATASWGLCPIYSYFKIRTAKLSEKQNYLPPD